MGKTTDPPPAHAGNTCPCVDMVPVLATSTGAPAGLHGIAPDGTILMGSLPITGGSLA
ncbi:hypothetical protein [Cutibacterium avidum]|uniref:hypothetical protein n=1 Tax=Cutibacterium avidum TaxID=33010 RepID=UPI0014870193|nr:hypothetical protein [Cutibacterium avidum]MDU3220051.1 hypothetical protein [Cutibacterium avidum]MDU5867968.1 hypothetical protein [Cutibacterium avidum]MDU7816756.1 hypothetical protein [Bacillota bacterium]MDU8015498.1 hypothetical protein [Cutibacterium avidum]